MELSDIPVPDPTDEAHLEAFSRAISPLVADGTSLMEATREVRDELTAVIDVEVEVRTVVDQATRASAAIITYTLPPYWPYMLGGSVVLALSGFVILARPEWRIPFIVGIGVALLGLVAHYALRLWRRSRTLGPLQEEFERLEMRSHDLFHDAATAEAALEDKGFHLETESFLVYREILALLCSEGPDGAALREKAAHFVTGDEERHPEPPSSPAQTR